MIASGFDCTRFFHDEKIVTGVFYIIDNKRNITEHHFITNIYIYLLFITNSNMLFIDHTYVIYRYLSFYN